MNIKTIEELKEEYKEWHEVFKKLSFERVRYFRQGMSALEEEMENERARKVEENIEKLREAYDEWKAEYNLFEIALDWSEEVYGFVTWEDERYFYKDWMTDHETNKHVQDSIHATDEKEVELFIENARKALESIGYTHDFDVYETHDYIDYIEYINRDFRHDVENGCMTVLAMDILENRKLWVPYREGFSDCLKNVSDEIDSTFLHFNLSDWDEPEWEEEFDEDDYYNN